MKVYDNLVIGAGPCGCAIARNLLDAGKKVLIVEKKNHIAGSTYDYIDEQTGLLVQKYGPHIFHTNSEEVFDFISRFTEWKEYKHRVSAFVKGNYINLPINYLSVSKFKLLTDRHRIERDFNAEIQEYKNIFKYPKNAYEKSLTLFGREITDNIFIPYTYKHWGIGLESLSASIMRVPFKPTWVADEGYFSDTYQCQPLNGYTELFKRMIAGCDVLLGVSNIEDILVENDIKGNKFWTGPLDELVKGTLNWRCSHFDLVREATNLKTPVINTPALEFQTTRMTDMALINGVIRKNTIISHESTLGHGEKTYPMPTDKDRNKASDLKSIVQKELKDWKIAGRLGTYTYFNMDQAIANGISVSKT
jgi:UDP-galactopyranose mutase